MDPNRHPAEKLACRYAEHWEQELYRRELKLDVCNESALASEPPETALQDIAALVLYSAVPARFRIEAAVQMKVPPQRMSFYKIKLATRPLWDVYKIVRNTLTMAQHRQAWQRYIELILSSAILPSCQSAEHVPVRALRQPVSS